MKLPGLSFIATTIDEGRKVIWPNRPTIIRHSVMVVASILVAVLIFASIDFGLQKLVLLALK